MLPAIARSMSVSLGLRDLFEQRRRRHDLARLAVAALDDVEVDPRLLHRLGGARRQAFDRRHALARDADTGAEHERRARLDVDGAGAALGDAAPVFGARETEVVAKHPQQRVSGSTSTTRLWPLTLSMTGMPRLLKKIDRTSMLATTNFWRRCHAGHDGSKGHAVGNPRRLGRTGRARRRLAQCRQLQCHRRSRRALARAVRGGRQGAAAPALPQLPSGR
jgi:hypothetical protein